MARQGNLNMDGSVRVVQPSDNGPAPAFVPGTNNGAFASITPGGFAGVMFIEIADGYLLGPDDVVDGQIEGDTPGVLTIRRLNQRQLQVFTFNQAGYNEERPYALNICRRFRV